MQVLSSCRWAHINGVRQYMLLVPFLGLVSTQRLLASAFNARPDPSSTVDIPGIGGWDPVSTPGSLKAPRSIGSLWEGNTHTHTSQTTLVGTLGPHGAYPSRKAAVGFPEATQRFQAVESALFSVYQCKLEHGPCCRPQPMSKWPWVKTKSTILG